MSHSVLRHRGLTAVLPALLLIAPEDRSRQQTDRRSASPLSCAFVNGKWFDGESFESKTVYSINGRLTATKPRRVGRTLDLKGTYVIPPFAEAHNHNLGSRRQMEETIRRYLADGVFYVKILSNLPGLTEPIRQYFNKPTSVDVSFANGGLTATGGHPVELRHRLLERGAYPGFTKETLKDHGYFAIDSSADLQKKWDRILEYRPDFIKVFLLFSEEFEKRKDDEQYFGRKGLDPALVPEIVQKAHQKGLRVSAHVNTATDFHHAVTAGVDEIAHLPGSRGPTSISPEDARLAAHRGIVVVTTASLSMRYKEEKPELYKAIREAQMANLKLLRESGVKIAVGSDNFEDTSVGEAMYLHQLGVFDNLALLKMWTETAARTTFPSRKIGSLEENHEASFVALEGDPIQDFENVKRIRFRVKQGRLLSL